MSVSWQQYAACAGLDPELFFPADAEDPCAAEAKAICATCPVDAECALYAEAIGARDGIWAGTDLGHLCGNRLHVMTTENTMIRAGEGTRCCRACRRATDKRSRLRRQEQEEAA